MLLSLGLCHASLDVVRKSEVDYSTMFTGFKNFVEALTAYLLVGLFTFLWSLLLIVPGIIKAYSYSMTMYVLADDPSISANEARKRSMQLMEGNKLRLFYLQISFIGWAILGVLSCGIFLLWVIPYYQTAQAEFYNSLLADQNSQPLNPEVTKA